MTWASSLLLVDCVIHVTSSAVARDMLTATSAKTHRREAAMLARLIYSEALTPDADARVTAALSKVVIRYNLSAPRPVHPRPARPSEQPGAEPTE